MIDQVIDNVTRDCTAFVGWRVVCWGRGGGSRVGQRRLAVSGDTSRAPRIGPPIACEMKVILESYGGGRMPGDCRVVASEIATRPAGSATTVPLTMEELERAPAAVVAMSPGDIAVGNAPFVKLIVERQGLPKQPAPDYPECLQPLLHRRLWTTTLGGAADELAAAAAAGGAGSASFYIKPAEDIKAFSGEQATPEFVAELLSRFPASLPVACSEKVTIACEHRVYVAHGRVLAVCHCPHAGCERTPPDMAVVTGAVGSLAASGGGLAGYGIDFCVIKGPGGGLTTALMEVNDGACCGFYEGVTPREYTAMVEARWSELLAGRAGV